MNDSTSPILTNITSTYLECTSHSPKYHCLLKIRSGGNDKNGSNDQDAVMAKPDISSLSVIPIYAAVSDQIINSRQEKDGNGAVYLLPKLSPISVVCQEGGHPSHELIRISYELEAQLKERLKDASDGVTTSCTMKSTYGIHEQFLLRAEAILQELLSAVQQQKMRKDQSHRLGNRRKRKAAGQTSMASSSSSLSSPPLKYYSSLVQQLNVLQSMSSVTDISLHKHSSGGGSNSNDATITTPSDVTSVSVTCIDDNKRTHTWHAELYPSIVLTMDMPSEFVLDYKNIRLDKWWEDEMTNGASTSNMAVLPQIQRQFDKALERFQPLFMELDDLDNNLWILEPSLPARRCSLERRIALWEGGASMVIVFDPENVRGVPVIVRFLGVTMATMSAAAKAAGGSDDGNSTVVDWRTSFSNFVAEDNEKTDTNKMKEKSTTNATTDTKRWSEKRSIRENLEIWFGSPLPSPLAPSNEKSDFLVECGICYTHRLPTEDGSESEALPEEKCSNPSCSRHYHESCLFEWLNSLPTARRSFDRVFGSCPYCMESLSTSLKK